ncbi:MAG: hypothetical protein EAZ07_02160 [Cytophagales bacterium]|nr:MAG: hypothetical protein EAZ07_02160 [Cytophagales bacterium]
MKLIVNYRLIFFAFIVFLFEACQNRTVTNELSKEQKNINVLQEYKNVSDSLTNSWHKMIVADDKKIDDIGRLIDEISYTKKYNLFLLDSVKFLQSKLQNKRYTQLSMENSELINAYDAATDSLIGMVFRLAKTTPSIDQYPTAMQLVQDINNSDNEVVIYRVRYDAWVRIYNDLMKRHSKEIKSKLSGEPKQEKYYLFSLNE